MKKFTVLIIGLLMVMAMSTTALAADNINVRALLGSGHNQTINIKSGNYDVTYADGTVLGAVNASNVITVNYDGVIKMSVDGNQSYEAASGLYLVAKTSDARFSYKNVQYRGDALLIYSGTTQYVVNRVTMDQYLYGVVGKEMGYVAPMEALKAQAICSRSYALDKISPNNKIYDVKIDTSNQVYGGYTAEIAPGGTNIINAVDATSGQVMYHNGTMVVGYFHTNAGGCTESSENVWSNQLSYLKGVKSDYDSLPYEYNGVLRFPYSYNWMKTYTWSEMEKIANKYAANGSIGKLKSINITTGGVSDRVERVEFIGTTGNASIKKDSIRTALNLKSTLFSVIQSGTLTYLGDNNDNITISNTDISNKASSEITDIVILGKGYGHGLGMSQWGAMVMASQGKSCADILDLYFNQGNNNGALTIEQYKGK